MYHWLKILDNMNKHNFILFVFLVCFFSAFGQIKFRKKIGAQGYDYAMSGFQIANKGYIVCGSSSSYGNGNSDVLVVKVDSVGNPGIYGMYGGINVDRGNCIKRTADNGYIITGFTNSFSVGGYDVYLIKLDSNLTEQWSKIYGGDDWDFGNSVIQTSDGGYLICGSTYSFGNGDEDYYLVKTNNLGDTTWTKTFGGAKQDVAKSVIETLDNAYLVTGFSKSLGDTLGDFYTVKIDYNGDTLWTNRFGGVQADFGNDLLESSSGYYIVCGETKSLGAGDSDGVVYQISTSGITGVNYTFGGSSFDSFESITERLDGKIAMTGKTTSFGFANANGEVLIVVLGQDWSFVNATTFGSYEKENAYSIEVTEDNGFFICGQTNNTSNLLEDAYIIKTDTLGFSTSSDIDAPLSISNSYSSNNFLFNIYPNPANHMIYVDFKNNFTEKKYFLRISNILGENIFEKELNDIFKGTQLIDVSSFIKGMYIVSLIDYSGRIMGAQKIIIEH